MKLQHHNINKQFQIYKSDMVIDNKDDLLVQGKAGVERFQDFFQGSTTWNFSKYNLFNLTAGYPAYYKLFEELKQVIRLYVGHEKPLWMQCWINYQMPEEVLDWHTHDGHICHGYLAVEPHKSKTIFREYEIDNKVGQLYIGRCELDGVSLEHKVVVLEDYYTPRVTIAFDVNDEDQMKKDLENNGVILNLSFIPI